MAYKRKTSRKSSVKGRRKGSSGYKSAQRGAKRSPQTLRIVIEQPAPVQTTASGQLAVESRSRKARF